MNLLRSNKSPFFNMPEKPDRLREEAVNILTRQLTDAGRKPEESLEALRN
jgi:hypothetical protein